MDAPNIQWPAGAGYRTGDRGTEALAVKDISPFVPDTIVDTQNFETDPIPGTGGGDLPWLTTTSSPHTGLRCFRSGAIANNQQSLWTFTIPATATHLRLWWRVSSEAGFDFLEIYKDSVSVPNRILQQSGTGNVWTQSTLALGAATTVIIRYVKDSSSSSGLDTVFVDDFEWIIPGAAAVQNYEPLHLEPTENRLKVDASFATPAHVIVDSLPEVEIKNDAGNPIPVSGTVAVSNFPATQVVSGTVNIGTIPEVEIKNDTGNPVPVSGTVSATQGTSPWVVSGAVTVSDGSGPLTVDGTVAVSNFPASQTVNGTVTADTNFDYPEDSVHNSGDIGAFVLAVRNDAGTPLAANGDYSPLQTNAAGELRVTTSGSSPTGRDDTDDQASVATGLAVGVDRQYVYDGTNWDRQRSGGVTGMAGVAGAEAHDAPATGNPILNGMRASIAAPAAVSADADVVNMWATRNGAQRVYGSRRRRTGLYYASLGNTTVTAAADGALVGRFWLVNPVGSTVFGAVRKVYMSMTTGSGLLVLTSPTFTVERITFTGTASGATITPAKRDSSDAANSLTVRTASTGMTITAGAAAHGFQVFQSLATTSNGVFPPPFPFTNDEDEYLILRAGEGIVIRQATAGTALDTRVCNFDLQWEEFNSTDFVVRD